jgi:thiamine biosynthesis lipoprotein
MTATYVGTAWSCTVRLAVEDERALAPATEDLTALLARVDAAASRFRTDSALSIANARAGRPTPVPAILVDLVCAAIDAARQTDGAVDPTLGLAMQRIGYDRDIRDVADGTKPIVPLPSAGRWRSLRLQREVGVLTVPAGTALDLGATAKAWTADLAARQLAARYGTGVLVELGGDVAVAGERPGGWCIQVAERAGGEGQLVALHGGGLTTSTTTVRRWQRAGRTAHHIVDPATGTPASGPWRTVTVAAGSAFDANTASTAAIVRGAEALAWLDRRGLAARLVAQGGAVVTTAGWPSPEEQAA